MYLNRSKLSPLNQRNSQMKNRLNSDVKVNQFITKAFDQEVFCLDKEKNP